MTHFRLLTLLCTLGFGPTIAPRWAEDPAPQAPSAPAAFDWPQWQGPDRTGVSKETGLLQQWPATGPPLLWSVSGLGAGYGSLAVRAIASFSSRPLRVSARA